MHGKLVVATAAFMVCPVFAADLLIANARIIDGTGQTIEDGSLLIEGEGILAITEGSVDPQGARVIDAGGMTVVPGFIDAHRHIFDLSLTSEQQLRDWVEAELPDKLMELLSAGITTTMSNADPFPVHTPGQTAHPRRGSSRSQVIGGGSCLDRTGRSSGGYFLSGTTRLFVRVRRSSFRRPARRDWRSVSWRKPGSTRSRSCTAGGRRRR